jgi:S1-C subfamily serine protease
MKVRWFAVSVLLVIPTVVFSQQYNNRQSADNGGWLGVEFVMESDKNRVVIIDMQPDGPAAQAKLNLGDVIARVGDMQPKNAQEFADEIARHNPGDKVMLTVMREGNENKIEVTLGRRPNGVPRR